MRYALAPKQATADAATLWLGAFADAHDDASADARPPAGQLVVGDTRHAVTWPTRLADAVPAVYKEELTIPVPAGRTAASLLIDGEVRASATVGALPAALPAAGE